MHVLSHSTKGGEDFVPIVESLSFGPDSSSEEQCRDIQINIDAALEPFQAFRIRAVLDSVDIMGSPQSPFIQSQNRKYIAMYCKCHACML